MPRSTTEECGGENVAAFLDMIAWCEIGPEQLKLTDDGYNVLFGSLPGELKLFDSYDTHPNVLTQFRYKNGTYGKSTAAGRYQLLNRYYKAYVKQLKLPDFSPKSQDQIAIQQMRERGSIIALKQNDILNAIARSSNIWASFPGAGYNQHEQKLHLMLAVYRKAGGQGAD
jgi:muramidase (phage lysozyme)